jgi:hypothetical protein
MTQIPRNNLGSVRLKQFSLIVSAFGSASKDVQPAGDVTGYRHKGSFPTARS